MTIDYKLDQKIEYLLFDAKGKAHWLPGRIHAISKAETPDGTILSVNYLVDTGRTIAGDGSVLDPADAQHKKHIQHIIETDGLDRQPEQISLPAERIRAKK